MDGHVSNVYDDSGDCQGNRQSWVWNRNEEGERIFELAETNSLVKANTYFDKGERRRRANEEDQIC